MSADLTGGTPEDSLQPNQVKTLQNYTENSVKDIIKQPVLDVWGPARNVFTGLLDGLFGTLGSIISGFDPVGWFTPNSERFAQKIRDGQEDLNGRTDLLSPLLDYCSLSLPPGTGNYNVNHTRLPFTHEIGPNQGVTVMGDGRVRLDDKGLWDLRSMVTAGGIPLWEGGTFQVFLRVTKPNGDIHDVFSEQGNFMNTTNHVTLTSVASVCIEEPGYFVDVYVIKDGPSRNFWSGPKWSRLTIQHISRKVENGTGGETSTDADDQDIPEEPDPNA